MAVTNSREYNGGELTTDSRNALNTTKNTDELFERIEKDIQNKQHYNAEDPPQG